MDHRCTTAVLALSSLVVACSGTEESRTNGTGGATAAAGRTSNGGVAGAAAVAVGGSTAGGNAGKSSLGGSNGLGGVRETGGTESAGASSRGGNPGVGGQMNGGGKANGGASATAGAGASSAGSTGTAGSSNPSSKRGIAANVAPGAEFYPSVSWWYNWAIRSTGTNVGLEFVPMVWNQTTVSASIPSGSKYLLGFNEPNFFDQANLSATQAASYWPSLQANANAAGVAVVGPGMNYCGPANRCHDTDPYEYLKDFFAACANCSVDYVAVHWYNCDLASLRDYLEPGGNLPGFEQFGKPIWITEFSCDGNASVAQQEAYMRAAIPYLERNPKVARYSWFSADPIPNAKLVNSDGSPTALGRVYIALPHE